VLLVMAGTNAPLKKVFQGVKGRHGVSMKSTQEYIDARPEPFLKNVLICKSIYGTLEARVSEGGTYGKTRGCWFPDSSSTPADSWRTARKKSLKNGGGGRWGA